jgi:hypothetical protein
MKLHHLILIAGLCYGIIALNDAERRADQCHVVVHSEVFP